MKNIDYPINNIIYWKQIKLKVIEQHDDSHLCSGCVFTQENYSKTGYGKKISCCSHNLECISHKRKDKKHVIFKFIKKL